MVCQLTSREMVKELVVNELEQITMGNRPNPAPITEKSRIFLDLGRDPKAARAQFYDPIADQVIEKGCNASKFKRDHVEKAKRVQGIVGAVWKAVKPK